MECREERRPDAPLPFKQNEPLAPEVERRRRIVTRALPLTLIALVAFVIGAVAGTPGSPEKEAAERFAERLAAQRFRCDVQGAEPGLAAGDRARATSPSPTATRRWCRPCARSSSTRHLTTPQRTGPLWCRCRSLPAPSPSARSKARSSCPSTKAASPGIRASSSPACIAGEHLESQIELAPRAPILAADGTPLAEGPAEARAHPLGSSAIDVTGEVGSRRRNRRRGARPQGIRARHPGRGQRARAGLQRPARRQARRLAAGGRAKTAAARARSPRPSQRPARR